MGKMKDETYKAFLMSVDYGQHNRIWEGSRYFKREDKVNGQCKLELVMEVDNVNEIFNYVPVKEWLFKPGDKFVQKFLIHQRYGFILCIIIANILAVGIMGLTGGVNVTSP